jgi:hypothetical protein
MEEQTFEWLVDDLIYTVAETQETEGEEIRLHGYDIALRPKVDAARQLILDRVASLTGGITPIGGKSTKQIAS